MKRVNLKPLVLSAVIAGSILVLSVQADNSSVKSQNMRETTESRSVNNPPDRNITNPNIGPHSNPVPDSTQDTSAVTTEIDHQGVVNFEPNSVTLTEQGERQLQQLVTQLDKEKPVSLTVAVLESGSPAQSSETQPSTNVSAARPDQRNAMTGRINPADGSVQVGIDDSQPRIDDSGQSLNGAVQEPEQADRAELISRYRMENIRRFLEEKGVEVVQWNMESEAAAFSNTQIMENSATDGRRDIQRPQASQAQDEVQMVRIVVIGEIQPEGLSSL
jgi:hypothetical protein